MSIADFEKVFTPSAPLRTRRFFFGRQQELHDLHSDLRRPGVQPIVIGDRGVGKTTLVRQATHGREGVITVSCGLGMRFHELATSILVQLGYDLDGSHPEPGLPRHPQGDPTIVPAIKVTDPVPRPPSVRLRLGGREVSPWTLFECLRDRGPHSIVIVDEYDLIPRLAKAFHANMAELLKHLSDNSERCNARVIIVGVARSAEALLGKHDSIARCADEIFVRPLRQKDVHDFLTKAEVALNFRFATSVRTSIVTEANGYPYYVHLMGLLCVEEMLKRNRRDRQVEETDLMSARRRAWNKSVRSVLGRHRSILRRLSRDQLVFLRTLVVAPNARSKRSAFEEHVRGQHSWTRERFDTTLVSLTTEGMQLLHLREKDDLVVFLDPLLPLFLRGFWFPARGTKLEDAPSDPTPQIDLFGPDDDEAEPDDDPYSFEEPTR